MHCKDTVVSRHGSWFTKARQRLCFLIRTTADMEWVPPHKWVGRHTFEHELDLPMTVNPHYSAKLAVDSKGEKSQEPPTRPKSSITQTKVAKPANGKRPKKARLAPHERKERNRKASAQRRHNRKERGLCKDCPNRAAEGRTRCADCAEKHRLIRGANR